MNITSEFADFALGIDIDALPERVVSAAETVLLDHIAAGMYGSRQPASRVVAEHALREIAGAQGRVPLYGRTELVPPGHAARVNGTASHGFELDDVYEPGGIHPAAVVIPAVVASAVDRGATGRELLTAIIVGYEIVGRIALAAGSQFTAFHSTGTHGIFGTTAAIGGLAGFDAERLIQAWGITASFSGGLKAFQSGGGEVKRIHGGRGGENALLAVSLTEAGLTGPVDILDNDRGFFAAYGKNLALDGITEPRERWVVEDVYFKPYASCAATHAVINSVKTILAGDSIAVDDVEKVIVRTSQRGVSQNSIPVPSGTMTVQYSIESAVALALLGTVDEPSSFVYDTYVSSGAPDVASRVDVRLDAEPEAAYPAKLAGGADIVLKGGRVLSAYEPGLRELTEPAERYAATLDKFHRVTRGLLTEDAQREVVELVGRLRSTGSPSELADLIGPRSVAAEK
ncbi:MAG: hypothetical protein GEV10_18840 [Streptosporangiales bacterium]|nr:hypothetical protein [Streptosporangiales bacterium]